MLKLALNELWCDIVRTCKSIRIVAVILWTLMIFLPSSKVVNLYCFVWIIEYTIMNFMPLCRRMYFILPLDEKDRKRFLVCKSMLAEGTMLVWSAVCVAVRAAVYGRFEPIIFFVAFFPLFMLFGFETIVFAEAYPEATLLEKAVSIVLAVVSVLVYFIMGEVNAENLKYTLPCYSYIILAVCTFVIYTIKLYFMYHAHYEEYRPSGRYAAQMDAENNKKEW